MLDSFEIITTSGVVLWSKHYAPVGVNIVNSLIKNVFIEENLAARATAASDASAAHNAPYKKDKYTLKWTTAKELGLIFVAVYHSLIQLSWIDKLLDNIKTIFTSLYGDQFKKPYNSVIECPFDEYFERQVQELEKTLRAMPTKSPEAVSSDDLTPPSSAEDEFLKPPVPGMRKAPTKQYDGETTSTDATPIVTPDSSRPATPNSSVLTAKGGPGGRTSRRARKAGNAPVPLSHEISSSDRGKPDKSTAKKGRKWDDHGMLDETEDQVLDYSAPSTDARVTENDNRPEPPTEEAVPQTSWGRKTKQGDFILKDLDEEMDSILSSAAKSKTTSNSSTTPSTSLVSTGVTTISSLFHNVVGGKTLTASDLLKPLKGMEDHLIRKNVARDAATHLCAAVSRDLVGTKTPSFTTIDATIRTSMDAALSKILTPTSGSSLDLLRSIQSVVSKPQQSGPGTTQTPKRPYVISIVGVNGVGKSTTLAKLAHLLLHNNLRVLVAAADTFRSGAVEQLRVHVHRLAALTAQSTPDNQLGYIDLYERGYGKDAAHIARDAVSFAAAPTDGTAPFNVVLIDTAGRRHNDTRLMSSLAPFARAAQPDKILMVGEALVGTDSVAQARHFNEAFGPGRGLDGFVVSKCDTVGEMVGTLVSLVWGTGVPVVAVGVGQHYGDLRGFRVGWARGLLLEGL